MGNRAESVGNAKEGNQIGRIAVGFDMASISNCKVGCGSLASDSVQPPGTLMLIGTATPPFNLPLEMPARGVCSLMKG